MGASLTSVLAAVLGLGACYAAGPEDYAQNDPAPPASSFPAVPAGPALDVLVLGDFGTGGAGQRAVADAIARTHGSTPPALVLTVGDNVYENGIQSVDDPHWDFVFTSVYRGPFWDDLPFRPTLGNHDTRGNAEAQVEMSRAEPRWLMPARHYDFREPVPGPGNDSVLFVALDTNVGDMEAGELEAEAAWLAALAQEDHPTWVVTYGHHPIAGGGPREPGTPVVALAGAFSREFSTIHLAGHDHILQVVPLEEGSLHAICGGGGGTDEPYSVNRDKVDQLAAFTGGGWCLLRFWSAVAALELYDAEGNLRHRSVLARP